MADFAAVADQFCSFYYQTFDSDRNNLAPLYRDNSMLTFEGEQFVGVANIVKKLVELPFRQVVHKVDVKDAQPSSKEGGILVLVAGALQVDGQDRPMSYTQTFQLLPDNGSYYVYNDVFRLVYPAS